MTRMECLRGMCHLFAARAIAHSVRSIAATSLAALLVAAAAHAQGVPLPPPAMPSPTPQFDVTGFIQSATVDNSRCPSVTDPLLYGGTAVINGVNLIVPCNTIIQLPAATLTWAMLFPALDGAGNVVGSIAAPAGTSTVGVNGLPFTPVAGQTGLALADAVNALGVVNPATGPFPSFEMRAVGNIVRVPDVAGVLHDQFIVGLIAPVSQQGANIGFGTITCIDYVNSYLVVGGDPSIAPNATCINPATGAPNGARVQLNDPIGRWGTGHSPDPRFSGDTNNTTVHAATGYPMCVPRTDPAVADDPLCPSGNRPLNGDPRFPTDPFTSIGAPLKSFTMAPVPTRFQRDAAGNFVLDAFGSPIMLSPIGNPPPNADPAPVYPDARYQVPFAVGDAINYSGTLSKDPLGVPYLSAHTIIANLGVFTSPGTQPAYVSVETILLGTGTPPAGSTGSIPTEPTTRIFIVGFTTDPSVLIDVNAVDVNPCTGQEILRLLGTVDPASQVVQGRFRFHVLGGHFMPPTREMIVASHDGPTDATLPFDPAQPGLEIGVSNGFGSGQYRLPNFDFIFPENIRLGDPTIAANFLDLPFLAQGSGPLNGVGTVVGQLIPWPGSPTPPAAVCGIGGAAPIVDAGFNIAVAAGRAAGITLGLPDPSAPAESLFGKATLDPNSSLLQFPQAGTVAWSQIAGPANPLGPPVELDPNTGLPDPFQPTFSTVGFAPGTVFTYQLTVTDQFGTGSSQTNVTVVDPATIDTFAPNAVWRAPKIQFNVKKGLVGNRVGIKGGIFSVTAAVTLANGLPPDFTAPPGTPNAAPELFVMGWGKMEISTLPGIPPGSYRIRFTGIGSPPLSVTVRSSFGGEAVGRNRIR
jgi:hypothetical protein